MASQVQGHSRTHVSPDQCDAYTLKGRLRLGRSRGLPGDSLCKSLKTLRCDHGSDAELHDPPHKRLKPVRATLRLLRLMQRKARLLATH